MMMVMVMMMLIVIIIESSTFQLIHAHSRPITFAYFCGILKFDLLVLNFCFILVVTFIAILSSFPFLYI